MASLRPSRRASSSCGENPTRGRTFSGGALDEDALAARPRADRLPQRPGEVRGVGEEVPADGHAVAAVADHRRDRGLVRTPQLEHDDLRVDEPVRVPAQDRLPVGDPLAAVHRLVGVLDSPDGTRRLEPLAGEPRDGHDLLMQDVDVGPDARVDLVVHRAAEVDQRATARRGAVGVVPVEDDGGGLAPRCVRHQSSERVHFG